MMTSILKNSFLYLDLYLNYIAIRLYIEFDSDEDIWIILEFENMRSEIF